MPRWLRNPHYRFRGAVLTFFASLVGWPVSMFVTDEPPWILSLSWLAITFTALDIMATADVRRTQEDE